MPPLRADPEASDQAIVDALRAGDEKAFLSLFERHHAAMVRLARVFVGPGAAEDVAQEAWLGVLHGIGAFEGRASLRIWIMGIVANRARSRFGKDIRSVPFGSLGAETSGEERAVDPERFRPATDPEWPGHWADSPAAWPEEQVSRRETLEQVRRAIEGLPLPQRTVITLRDVEGWSSEEICSFLGISEVNQRVLLHRARSRVRRALEEHLAPGEEPA